MTVELKLGTLTRQVGPTKPRIMIGRDEQSCELWIHDESVSRRHAEVFLQGHAVYIRDLGSSNGTWVNGQPLGPHPVELAPGQIVYVGHAPLGVEWTQSGGGRAATVMAALPPELMAMMAQRRQQQLSAPQPAYAPPPMQYAQPPQPMQYAPQSSVAPVGSPAEFVDFTDRPGYSGRG